MIERTMEVIKKCRVLMAGSIPIGSDATGLTPAHDTPAQVRVTDQTDGVMVLEVICACGHKTYIQCDMENVMEKIQAEANETVPAQNEQEN